MIEVELPDGTVVEFPEGTTPETIKSVLGKRFAKGNTAADRIAAAKAGTLTVPADRAARQAEIDAMAMRPERTTWDAIKDNVIGNPDDGVQSFGESLGTWLNRAGESMTLGVVGDEASAAAYSMLPGRTYRGELDRFRGNERGMSTVGRLSADVAGAILPALAGVGMVSGATSLPGKIGAGAAFGAGAGAVQGFAEGEGGVADRLKSGAVGGTIGGAFGAAVPVIAEVGKSAWRSVADTYRAARIAREAGGKLGISPEATTVVGNIVGSDDADAMRRAMGVSGQDAMLADASPMLGGVLDGVKRSPVQGARFAYERIEARAAKAYRDIMDAVNPSGAKRAVGEAMEDVRTGSAAARREAYEAAYSKPIDYSSREGALLLDTVTPRLPGKAISYANELMKLKGEKSAQIMATIADDGSVTFRRPPDVRQWDYIKQALDQLAESGDGAGALGGQTRLGAAYQSLARLIRDSVAKAVPEYGDALKVAADSISERNAVKFGADLLSPKVTTYDAVQGIKAASPAERDAMRVGVIAQIDEIIGNVRAVPSDQNIDAREAMAAFKMMTSANAQKKLAALFGEDWPLIRDEIGKAGAALGLRARTAANSSTAGGLMVDRAVTEATTPSPLRRGEVVQAVKDFAGGITGSSPEALARLRDDVKGEIADLLTRQGGQGQAALETILAALAANPVNPVSGRAAYNALALGGFMGTPVTTDRVRNQLAPR